MSPHEARFAPGAGALGRAAHAIPGAATPVAELSSPEPHGPRPGRQAESPDLARALSEIKGQAHFLLYLAEQLEDAIKQLRDEPDPGRSAFLCKILSMYSAQMETKHQGLGDRIAEACQEVYIAVREHDMA